MNSQFGNDLVGALSRHKGLIKKVTDYFLETGNPLPEHIIKNAGKIAFLPIHIASSSSIDLQFYGYAKRFGLKPVFAEFLEDKFVSSNGRKKLYLHSFDKFGNVSEIVKPNLWEGKKLSEITLSNGQSLVNYHHERWDDAFSGTEAIRFDLSSWLQFYGKAEDYYKYVKLLYTVMGIEFWPANIEYLYRVGESERLNVRAVNPAKDWVKRNFNIDPYDEYFYQIKPVLF
jgi:hypothetical protein